MAVKLRLRRMGRKKRPFYRIVAADARSPRDGRFIEEIGYYNPLTDPLTVEVNEQRALYWLQKGAIPTDTVKSLLRRKGIILKFDLMRQGLPEEKIAEELKKWEVLQLERRKREEARRLQAQKVSRTKSEAETAESQETAESEAGEEKANSTAEASAEEQAQARSEAVAEDPTTSSADSGESGEAESEKKES